MNYLSEYHVKSCLEILTHSWKLKMLASQKMTAYQSTAMIFITKNNMFVFLVITFCLGLGRYRPKCHFVMEWPQNGDCGQWQTTNHTVDTCQLTKFEGGPNLLHEADDDAVIWL